MAETYCGKTCAECAQKDSLNCQGCKAGPGRQLGGSCELAQCVRAKGHETCDTCSFQGSCGTLRSRDSMPDYHRRKAEAEQQSKAAIAKRSVVLGKWLWIIFWLVIPSTIASFMTQETVVTYLPGLYLPGQILNAICLFTYGGILIRLSPVEDRYKSAGICAVICGIVSSIVALISAGGEAPTWTLFFTLPAAIVAFVGEYNEYMAHCAVLTGVDNELSEKWAKLWKWYIGMYAALLGSLFVILLSAILGLLVVLAVLVGMTVTSILKLVYLYRTAKIFREYQS